MESALRDDQKDLKKSQATLFLFSFLHSELCLEDKEQKLLLSDYSVLSFYTPTRPLAFRVSCPMGLVFLPPSPLSDVHTHTQFLSGSAS